MDMTTIILNKKLNEIMQYYSLDDIPCTIETALGIALDHELERIKENETNNNKTR